MYGRQIMGGAHGGYTHLVRYVNREVCTDHAYKQARSTSRKPRELHTCISDSKWRAMKALNLDNFTAHGEVAFKSRKIGDCSINVVKDDISKETPCIINIYLKSSGKKRRKDDDDDNKNKTFSWEEINASKTNWVEAQAKMFTRGDPIESDADILRSKLLAVKVKRNEESQTKSVKCQELHAQQKLLCYNVSVYNSKMTRSMEYQEEYNSKKVMSEMIHLAHKQSEASGISQFLSFCKNLLSTDVKTNQTNRNETRINTTRKWKVAQVYRPDSSVFTPTTTVNIPKPRISPRTLSDFNLFKTTGFDPQVCGLQRCYFSSKSNSGKGGEKNEDKKKNSSILDQCINKIFTEIKKTCFGEAKEAKKTTPEAPPPEQKASDQKTSGKDVCLEKSLARLKQISGGSKTNVQIDKKEKKGSCIPADASKKENRAGPEKQATKDDAKVEKKGDKSKKICSKSSPLKTDASKKEITKEKPPQSAKETTKEKVPRSAEEGCKKDSSSKKQERPICAKDPQVSTCRTDVPKPATSSDTQQATQTTKIISRETRCIQDGDTPKEELEGTSQVQKVESEPKKETNERAICGVKGKRDPCKKYRIMWEQKMTAKKKESCALEKTDKSKKDTSCESILKQDICNHVGVKGDASSKDVPKKGTCSMTEKTSTSKKDICASVYRKDTCSQGGVKRDLSKRDPCSQSGTHEKASTSKKNNTCVSVSKKDTCSKGRAEKDTITSKKDPCSQEEIKKDTCSPSGASKCSQDGAKAGGVSKKDPCSQSGTNDRTSTSKKDTTCLSILKKDICPQGSAKGVTSSGGVSKKDACSRGGAKGDMPSGGANKKDSCSQRISKKETKDSCSSEDKSKTGRAKTKKDCDKFIAAKREGISGVCDSSFPKDECVDEEEEYNKCEDSDGGDQTRRGIKNKLYDTVVEAWDPPHDIMNTLGCFLDDANKDEIDDYFGDSYPNRMYYMYTREFFYDVNAMLQDCRQPQPVAMFKGKEPVKTEVSCEGD